MGTIIFLNGLTVVIDTGISITYNLTSNEVLLSSFCLQRFLIYG